MMNWQYIAGFFDGEGCVCWPVGYGASPQVFVTQSDTRGYILLDGIQKFLAGEGIITRLVKAGNRPPRKPNWNLYVSGRESHIKFMKTLLPYVHIKRTVIQDSLRFFKLFPPLSRGAPQRDNSRRPVDDKTRRASWRQAIGDGRRRMQKIREANQPSKSCIMCGTDFKRGSGNKKKFEIRKCCSAHCYHDSMRSIVTT